MCSYGMVVLELTPVKSYLHGKKSRETQGEMKVRVGVEGGGGRGVNGGRVELGVEMEVEGKKSESKSSRS